MKSNRRPFAPVLQCHLLYSPTRVCMPTWKAKEPQYTKPMRSKNGFSNWNQILNCAFSISTLRPTQLPPTHSFKCSVAFFDQPSYGSMPY